MAAFDAAPSRDPDAIMHHRLAGVTGGCVFAGGFVGGKALPAAGALVEGTTMLLGWVGGTTIMLPWAGGTVSDCRSVVRQDAGGPVG